MLRQFMSETNRRYQQKAREIAHDVIAPLCAELDRTREYPDGVFEILKAENMSGIWVPKDYGGPGASIFDLVLVIEEFARVCGGVACVYAVNALGSFPLLIAGNEEQKRKYLPGIAAGDIKTAFGLSEKNAGSDAGSLQTLAEVVSDKIVLNGAKKWTTNASAASLYTIFANSRPDRGARGITAYLVEKGTAGFSVGKREDLMGIRCVPVHELQFNDCAILPEQQLGKEGQGFKIAMQTLDNARPGIGAQAVGIAQGAFELAVKRVQERKQFDQPLVRNQAIQFLLADMGTQIHASRLLVHEAAHALDSGDVNHSLYAAMAKLMASDTAMDVTTKAVQLFGGYGYCRDYPIEKFMRDAKITQIYEGTNEIQRLVIGRALIKNVLKSN